MLKRRGRRWEVRRGNKPDNSWDPEVASSDVAAAAVPLPCRVYSARVLPLPLACLSAQRLQTLLALAVSAWFRSFPARSWARYGPSASSSFLLLLLIPLAGATHPGKLTSPSSSSARCGSSEPCQVPRLQRVRGSALCSRGLGTGEVLVFERKIFPRNRADLLQC